MFCPLKIHIATVCSAYVGIGCIPLPEIQSCTT